MKSTIVKMKLFMMALGAVLVLSCSAEDGEDGAIGPMGTPGLNGIDGEDGTNGTNGEDGNANVIASTWLEADFPDSYSFSAASVTISDVNITQEVLSTYTILGYFSFSDTFEDIYAIPFTEPLFRSFTMEQRLGIGEYIITELGNPDTVGTLDPIDGFVRYILIAPSSLTGKNATIDYLKKSGVDINDYNAVMDYYGLEY